MSFNLLAGISDQYDIKPLSGYDVEIDLFFGIPVKEIGLDPAFDIQPEIEQVNLLASPVLSSAQDFYFSHQKVEQLASYIPITLVEDLNFTPESVKPLLRAFPITLVQDLNLSPEIVEQLVSSVPITLVRDLDVTPDLIEEHQS